MTRLKSNEVLTGAGMALAGLAIGSALLRRAPVNFGEDGRGLPGGRLPNRRPNTSATVRAARRLNRAAGTLAASVLADSSVEHYRGSFKNKAMFTPLIVSALTLATSIHGTSDMRPVAHRARDTTYLLAAATGLIGTGFHIYNVGKKVGGALPGGGAPGAPGIPSAPPPGAFNLPPNFPGLGGGPKLPGLGGGFNPFGGKKK